MNQAGVVHKNARSPLRPDSIPALDDKQIGAINHIRNLSRQPVNDWSHMMGRAPMQEDYGAYRYQLAYMYYAAALAHKHRLPGAPGVFKDISERLIEKMLHPEVWLYWRNTSQGKGPFTSRYERLQSETDPVVRDNIMYSGYLQTMSMMHHAMFNDDRYCEPGALTFTFAPSLCLLDEHLDYAYDERSLNECVYWSMVESGYLGVACEPMCVFQICNQIPILGFRLHDTLFGGSLAPEVTSGYLSAWNEFGGVIGPDGHYTMLVDTRERRPMAGGQFGPWGDAWCGMLMNMWNAPAVRDNYARLRDEWVIEGPGATKSVRLAPIPPSLSGVPEGTGGDFGWMAAWSSEMGDQETIDGLLAHADRYMKPRWENGGFYYPRCDAGRDAFGNLTTVDPTTGNALLHYARLNVEDGLRKFYENPRVRGDSDPAIMSISNEASLRRASFEEAHNALVFTPTAAAELSTTAVFEVAGVAKRGSWSITADGQTVGTGHASGCDASGALPVRVVGGSIFIEVPLASEPDIVVYSL